MCSRNNNTDALRWNQFHGTEARTRRFRAISRNSDAAIRIITAFAEGGTRRIRTHAAAYSHRERTSQRGGALQSHTVGTSRRSPRAFSQTLRSVFGHVRHVVTSSAQTNGFYQPTVTSKPRIRSNVRARTYRWMITTTWLPRAISLTPLSLSYLVARRDAIDKSPRTLSI